MDYISRLRKFTVGINGLEFTRDAQIKYLARFSYLNFTSFLSFLQVPSGTMIHLGLRHLQLFYNPQICSLKYTFFFVSRLTLCVIASTYFPSIPYLFFSLFNICVDRMISRSHPAAFDSSAF